uniref:Uncharacterized protein n=1 Tax=Glossina brevipalpis TaxID=37001 RepID=A0A1A9WQV1_9MUSC
MYRLISNFTIMPPLIILYFSSLVVNAFADRKYSAKEKLNSNKSPKKKTEGKNVYKQMGSAGLNNLFVSLIHNISDAVTSTSLKSCFYLSLSLVQCLWKFLFCKHFSIHQSIDTEMVIVAN